MTEPDRPDDSMLDPATEVDSPESEPFHFESEATHVFDRSDEELRALVAEILPAVPVIARLVAREVGIRTDLADLNSVGNVALMEAARTFDPSRATFATYSRRKLRWAMLDSVRSETYGRGTYSRARAVAGADRVAGVATAHPPDPTLPESSHARKLRTLIAAQAAALAVGLASPFAEESTSGDGSSGALVAYADPSPEDLVLRHRFSAELTAALQELPERQRELVTRHYFKGERFDDIAASLGVSKSWASRLHAQAMETLAERLRDHR